MAKFYDVSRSRFKANYKTPSKHKLSVANKTLDEQEKRQLTS